VNNKLCFILCQDKAFEDKTSQTGATKLDLEPFVSTTDTQQNIEPPYPDIAKLTVMDISSTPNNLRNSNPQL
jgi:hypothetical protein